MDEFSFGGNVGSLSANRGVQGSSRNIKDECIIAFKVYDSCRQQDCLTGDIIGPARAAGTGMGDCGGSFTVGEIIVPPSNAAAVTVSDLVLSDVIVVSKQPGSFRPGYWDIDLKYVFSYTLSFRNIDGEVFCTVDAQSVYNKTVSLFGSVASDTVLATDLFNTGGGGQAASLSGSPFVLVESKAVALKAELGYDSCCCSENGSDADTVDVTIGLFTIIKLYRVVNLVVESKGFCIPEPCTNVSAIDPCEYFSNLDFPLDIFAPPQKNEFFAGISSNIPADTDTSAGSTGSTGSGCGCSCGCGR